MLGVSSKPISLERPLFGQCARQIAPIRSAELEAALAEQQRCGGRLGDILYDLGLLTRDQILETLRLQARFVAASARADVACLPYPCKLSVCMPAYNEADNIRGTLESAISILPEFVQEFELVVTNDGSTDDTVEVVREFSEECEHSIKLVNHPKNRGYGAAVATAMRAATGDLVMLLDSDGQFNLLDLPQFLAAIQKNDVVVGYRINRADSKIRKVNAALWTSLISVLLKVKIRDLDCAFKLFRRSDLEKIEMASDGASINAEIMTQCVARGLSICELPVMHYPCYFGTQTGANLRVIMKAFQELPRLSRYRNKEFQETNRRLDVPSSSPLTPNNGSVRVSESTNLRFSLDRPAVNGSAKNGTLPAPTEPRLSICLLAACPFPANHGTSGSIREMAEAVADRGHDVHIVTYHIGEDIDVSGPIMHRIPRWSKGTKVVIGPTIGRMFSDFLLVFKALQVIWRHSPDVIHAHGYEAGIAAGICRLLTRVPVVYSGHNTMTDELASFDFIRPKWLANAFAKFLDRYVPRVGDRCVPHSESLLEFFHDSGLKERTEPVIRFGIDLKWSDKAEKSDLRQKYNIEGPVILYAGVLDKFQRIDLLLEAMVRVSKAHPDAHLLIAVTIPAEKNLNRVKSQAGELGISDRVIFTEPLDLDGVRQCLQMCDVTTIPRPGAPGFPIKLLNYMSASKPCVMFASSASGLVHRQHALLIEQDTSEALAGGLLELLGDENLRNELGKNAYEFLLEHHDRRLTAKQLCDVYFRTLLEADKRLPVEPAIPSDCWEDVARAQKNGVHLSDAKQLAKSEYESEQQELIGKNSP